MHTVRDKQRLLGRVKRIRGQLEGIERALTAEVGCEAVLHQIAGIRGALAGLMTEVVEEHIETHLVDKAKYPGALDTDAAAALMAVIRSYLK